MTAPDPADPRTSDAATDQLVRDLLERVADRWSLEVLDALERGTRRFQELRRAIPEISQKMLTQTLRRLERDGCVRREIEASVPPRVDYTLTPLGLGLAEALCSVWQWAQRHGDEVREARRRFAALNADGP